MTNDADADDAAGDEEHPSVWIFQGSPDQYRLTDSLAVENEEYWNLRQHATAVRRGDRVLIWISGAEAGIYALGTVVSDPVLRPDSAAGLTYWAAPTEGTRPRPRVLVRYDRVMLDRPLLKEFLVTDPVLSELRILRNPRGTNFPVTAEEWAALEAWLDT